MLSDLRQRLFPQFQTTNRPRARARVVAAGHTDGYHRPRSLNLSPAGSPGRRPPRGSSVATQPRQGNKHWYYELKGRSVGPIPESDLQLLAENGTLVPDARVWSDG